MNAINIARDPNDEQQESAHSASSDQSYDDQRDTLTGKLYRFHGFRVLDADGREIGLVDWIWSNPMNGRGEFIGVHLQWLRGKVRPVPASNLEIDMHASTVRVMYTKEQIKRVGRYAIDRELSASDKRAIHVHYKVAAAIASRRIAARRLIA